MVHIHWSEMDQRFWLNDGDEVLWFDSPLQAQAAQRDIELRDARLEERASCMKAIEVELAMCALANEEASSDWIDGFEFAWKRGREAIRNRSAET